MALEDHTATAAATVRSERRSGGYHPRRRSLPTASSSGGGNDTSTPLVDGNHRQQHECLLPSSSSSAATHTYFNSEAARTHFHVPSQTFPDAAAEIESRIRRLHAAWVAADGWKKLLRDPQSDAPHFSRTDQFSLLKKALLVKTALRKMLRIPPELSPERRSSAPTAEEVAGDFSSCCRRAVEEVDVNVRLGTTVEHWCEEFNSQGGYFGVPLKPNGHTAYLSLLVRRGEKRKVAATPAEDSSSSEENAAKQARGPGERSSDDTADAAVALSAIGVTLETTDSSAAASTVAFGAAAVTDGSDSSSSPAADPNPAPHPADSGKVSKKFMDMFNQLKAYRDEHGHCNVTAHDKTNPKLGRWVRTLRSHRKLYDSGRSNVVGSGTPSHTFKTAAAAKIELLDGIGFQWVVNRCRPWEEYFEALRAYGEEHGDLLVPIHHPELGVFVEQQRGLHRRLLGGRSAYNLTPARIQQLNDLGFTWELTREDRQSMVRRWGGPTLTAWDTYFNEMIKFREENPVGENPRSNSRLAMWMRKQRYNRRLMQAGRYGDGLTDERIARLDKVGFDWGPGVTAASSSSSSSAGGKKIGGSTEGEGASADVEL